MPTIRTYNPEKVDLFAAKDAVRPLEKEVQAPLYEKQMKLSGLKTAERSEGLQVGTNDNVQTAESDEIVR